MSGGSGAVHMTLLDGVSTVQYFGELTDAWPERRQTKQALDIMTP